MTTIAETFIEQGREKGRQEMEQAIQKVRQEAIASKQQEVQKVRQEMVQEVQRAYQEARNSIKRREIASRGSGLKTGGLPLSDRVGLELKFGKEGLRLFNEVQQIQEMSLLSAIRAALKFVSDLGELRLKASSCKQLAIRSIKRRKHSV